MPIDQHRRRPQHRHDRPQLARHDRRDRKGALRPRRDAQAGQRRPPRARHDRDRRPVAGGAVLLPLGSLQLRPQGRADSLLLQRRASGLSPRSPIRPTRSTARRSRGFSACCTIWARRSANAPSGPSGSRRATRRSWTQRPVSERWRRGYIARHGRHLADFNAFRTRMNDLILGARQSHDQPLLRARQPGLRAWRAGHQDEGDARARVLARAPLRRLRHLPRRPLPRGRGHARGVPGDLLGGTGGGREHRDPAPAARDGAARGVGSDSRPPDYQRVSKHPRDDQHRPHRLRAGARARRA